MAKHTVQDSVTSNADIPATPTVVTQAPHNATTSASNDVVLSQLHGNPLSLTIGTLRLLVCMCKTAITWSKFISITNL